MKRNVLGEGDGAPRRIDTLTNAKRNRFQNHGAKWKKALVRAVAAWTLGMAPVVYAHPILDAKDAAVSISGTTNMNITSAAANNLIKWVDFSIGKNESVTFDANNYLNYVTGSARSDILGTLTGGGSIYIVNPNGILIGDGATVNVGSLHLSTRTLTDSQFNDFKADKNPLTGGTIGGDVINMGTLNATSISVEGNNITFKNAADVTKGGTIGNDGKITGGTAHNDSAVSLTADGGEIHIGSAKASTPGYTMTATAATAKDLKIYMYKLINDAKGLQAINNNRSGNYMLAGNIDMSGLLGSFTPLGTYDDNQHGFTGHFDGLNYEIQKFSFTLENVRNGLFDVNNGVIENLGLTGDGVIAAKGWVGGIVALNGEDGVVRNVYNTSNVTGTNGVSYVGRIVGGIVGVNRGRVERAYNTGAVQCNSSEEGVGGIVGSNEQDGAIRQVFNAGIVSGKNQVGGIVGVQKWTEGYSANSISDAYNTGEISGTNEIGGIVGHVYGDKYGGKCSITNVYNSGARGIAGNPGSGTLTNTYTSADGDLTAADTFKGFDFSPNGVWRIYKGKTTPLLTAFLTRKDNISTTTYNGGANVGTTYTATTYNGVQEQIGGYNYIKDVSIVTPAPTPTPEPTPTQELPTALETIVGSRETAKEYTDTIAALESTARDENQAAPPQKKLAAGTAATHAAPFTIENGGVNTPPNMDIAAALAAGAIAEQSTEEDEEEEA